MRRLCLVIGVAVVAGCHLIFPFDYDGPDGADATTGDGRVTNDRGGDTLNQDAAPGPSACATIAGGGSNDSGNAVALDKAGNIYVVGDFTGKIKIGQDELDSVGSNHCFLASYTKDCAPRWATALGGSSSDVCDGVAIDDVANRAYVLRASSGTVTAGNDLKNSAAGSTDVMLAAYDRAGSFKWLKLYGTAAGNIGHGITLDNVGNIFVVGITTGAVDLGGGTRLHHGINDAFVLALDPSGNWRWDARIGGAGWDFCDAVAADNKGNVYVAAGIFGKVLSPNFDKVTSHGLLDLVLASFNTKTGKVNWARGYGGPLNEHPWALTVHNDLLHVTGAAVGQPDLGGGPLPLTKLNDTFVASYRASDGGHRWSMAFGSPADDWGMGIDTDGAGNVYVVGIHQGPFKVDNTADKEAVPYKGGTDLFVSSFTPSGNHRWTHAFGGPGLDTGLDLDVDQAGFVHAVGYFMDLVDFGSGGKKSAGYMDAFMVRYRR